MGCRAENTADPEASYRNRARRCNSRDPGAVGWPAGVGAARAGIPGVGAVGEASGKATEASAPRGVGGLFAPEDWRTKHMEEAHPGARERRIAEIGRRANVLRRAGFYNEAEVRWLAEYVRGESALLVEVELLLTDAERRVEAKQLAAAAA